MFWSFKARAIFSPNPSRLLHGSSPPDVSSEENTSPAPSSPGITVTRTDPAHERDSSKPWLCACGYQQLDFCPYCDYDQTRPVNEPFVPESPSSLNFEGSIMAPSYYDFLNQPPPPRKRKLRKFRPHYQQLQYETLDVQAVVSDRPDSVFSTHSRTPLLNRDLPSNPNYPPLPSNRRTPKKLEKREKTKGSISMSELSSHFTSLSNSSSDRVVVRSRSFLQTKIQPSLGPRPKPVSSSMDTDALVSFAWTGEALSPIRSPDVLFSESHGGSLSPYTESRPTSVIAVQQANPRLHLRPELSTSNSSKRRSVLRKAKELGIQQPLRPWTLAMAIADDGISDENFVDDLENMRIKQEASKLPSPDPHPLGLCPPPFYQLLDSYAEYPLQPDELEQDSNPPLDSSWTSARQALLLCRELIRTERRYISSLKTLITNGTSTPPPPEMLPYLPGLITASEAFLGLMEQNPSVQGVSEALLALSGNLNDSFVSWCRVVGRFFDSEESGRSKSDSEDNVELSPSGKLRNPRSRATSMRAQTAESRLSVVISEPNKIRRNTKKRPTVRDLAIQPTQRIMRYVLLFKELHSLTPITLPSFVLVKQALQIAQSIAQAANEAQGHAAFRQPNAQTSFVQPAAPTT